MIVSDGGVINVKGDSALILDYDSLLKLENKSNIYVQESEMIMSFSSLHLAGRSQVIFNDSFFKTINNSLIKGNTVGYFIPIFDFESSEMSSETLGRGLETFNIEWIVKGDRLEFHNTRVRMEGGTKIETGSDEHWDGLYFYDSEQEGGPAEYNILKGEVSGIKSIKLDNSFLDLSYVTITEIGQVSAVNNSKLHMHGSFYHDNLSGIHVYDNSMIHVWDSDIFDNTYGILLEHSLDHNYIMNSRIYNNHDFGLKVVHSSLTTTNTEIYNNLNGYVDLSTDYNKIHGGEIYDNNFAEVTFRREYYPLFCRDENTMERPIIGKDTDKKTSYLMMAIGESDEIVNTYLAVVDTTDASRFFPSKSIYSFNNPLPIQGKYLFELATEKFETFDYHNAMLLMKDVVTLYPESVYARYAISYLPRLQRVLDSDIDELIEFYENIENDDLESNVSEAIASTYLANRNYSASIERYDQIIQNNQDTLTSLFATLNRIYAAWKLEQETNSRTTPNTAEYIKNRALILSQLLNYIDDENDGNKIPIITKLEASNYPNPFNPETTIKLSLPETGNVRIDIYNIRGQRVKTLLNNHLNKGYHSILWNGTDASGRNVSSGVYFYRVITEAETIINRMLLMK